MLDLPARDVTAGFRAHRRSLLDRLDLATIRAVGYGFQIGLTHRARLAGARIVEVPIRFGSGCRGRRRCRCTSWPRRSSSSPAPAPGGDEGHPPPRRMAPVATPIAVRPDELTRVRFNDDGLVPAVVQEQASGRVLMLGWMNEVTLRRTLAEGRTVFWSRSRQEEWAKGDTSGDRQWVREAWYDCDGDVLLFLVEQEGRGACHTGERSCFFRRFGDDPAE